MRPIDIETSHPTECDFSGKTIKMKEPRMKFLQQYTIKMEEVEEFCNLMKYCNKKTDIEKESGMIIKYEETRKSYCDTCDYKKNNVFCFDNKKEGDSARYLLCSSCLKSISESMRELRSKTGEVVYYWDSSGFCVRELSEKIKTFYSDKYKNPSEIETNCIIEIGEPPEYLKLRNIEKFEKSLRKMENKSDYYQDLISCMICEENNNATWTFKNKKKRLCPDCRDNLMRSISDFSEEKKSFIMSRVI